MPNAGFWRTWGVCCLLAGLTGGVLGSQLQADEPAQESKPAEQPKATGQQEPAETEPASPLRVLEQPLDDPLLPFEPKTQLTPEDQKRQRALALFMTGRIQENRRNFREALRNYQEAVELDPKAVTVYQSLVPLSLRLGEGQQAVEYAQKAIALDPGEYKLRQALAVILAGQRQVPEAIQMLEDALKSPRLDQESPEFVRVHRDLAILHSAVGKMQEAAGNYVVVFEALVNPRKFKLDDQTHARLMGEEMTSFEKIGQTFLMAQRYELAIQAFEQAVKTRQGNPGTINFYLAQVYVQTKEPEKALEKLDAYFAAQLKSKGREPYELLADILKNLNRSDELISRLEQLAGQDTTNAPLHYFLAEQYVAADRLEDASKLYQRLLKEDEAVEGYRGLAVIYRRQQNAEKYLETLTRAVPRDLDIESIQEELETAIADEQFLATLLAWLKEQPKDKLSLERAYLLGLITSEAKQMEEAVAYFDQAISEARGEQRSQLFNTLGGQLLVARRYAEASAVFERAVKDPELSDNTPNFLYRLSQAREFNGETEKALEALSEAKQIIRSHPLLDYQEGWIYYHAGQYEKAIPIFERVIQDHADNADIVRRSQGNLSNIYVKQGDFRKGEEILERILETAPDDPGVNNDLGYLYADQGHNLEKAEKMIRKALDAEPNNGAYLDSMGWVLYKLGKHKEALEYLEKSAKTLSGEDATIQDHLGDCYNQLQMEKQARAAWEKALKAAQGETPPDKKLIERIEEKLKAVTEGVGELKPAPQAAP